MTTTETPTQFSPGQRVVIDRSLLATFVKDVGNGRAAVRVGSDTRVVSKLILGTEEA